MIFTHRIASRGLPLAVVLGGFGLGLAGGCSGQPKTGTQVEESAELKAKRTSSIKSAMERGAYGTQYKAKPEPSK